MLGFISKLALPKIIDFAVSKFGFESDEVRLAKKDAKIAEIKAKATIKKAQIDLALKTEEFNALRDLEIMQANQKTLFDEFLTLLLIAPVILLFIPSTTSYVIAGFKSLQDLPAFYQVLLTLAFVNKLGGYSLIKSIVQAIRK
jgi:hypothetical protein